MPRDITTPQLEAIGVSKVLSDSWVLRSVHLSVGQRDRVLLYGPNGAGKTTLLKILCGIQRPNSGQVRVFGHPIERAPRSSMRHLGLLLSRGFFAEELTLEENLHFFGKLYSMDKRSLDERIDGLLSWAGLEHARRSPVFTLSTGQRQRLALVRVRLHDPSLLILDEPFNGLDEEALGFVRELFIQTATVLFTSHDLSFAKELATTVLLIKRGRIVAETKADNPSLMNVVVESLA